MKRNIWKNKKYGKTEFFGRYERDSKGERIFVLIALKAPFRRVVFESHQMAKSVGWFK
jgi:hypothetical protein